MIGIDGSILGVGRRSLHTLRQVLEREFGDQAAAALQEAGYAGGDEVYEAFRAWLVEHVGLAEPGDLDTARLSDVLGDFFTTLGWGSVVVEPVGTSGLAVDSPDWAEADPAANTLAPACHITAGLLAGFLGRLAEDDVAVMEIECRTRNDSRCRFLAGSPETLQAVYDAMSAGRDYHEVLGG